MSCYRCGRQLPENTRYCPSCGTDQHRRGQLLQAGADQKNLTGFSERINDPAFARYVKNSRKYSLVFSLVMAFVAVLGFAVAGEVSPEMDNPQSLYIGMVIGGMFLAIALYQLAGRRSKTWDGTVVDKKTVQKRRRSRTGDNSLLEKYTVYSVFIKSDDGRLHEIRAENDNTLFNYFRVGDRVRHHGNLNTYEKYDKSGDTVIFCAACASPNDINSDLCARCRCPLLN